jgi:hypothetical protein
MFDSMPDLPENPYAEYMKSMTAASNPYAEFWKYMPSNPVTDYWKGMMPAANPFDNLWKAMMPASNPFMDYWNKMFSAETNPFTEYWKSVSDKTPDFSEFWKTYTDMIPSMQNAWDNFAKMMPNPEKFANLAQFKVPGLDTYTKVFDMWKSFGDPTAYVEDFQKKYMDATADIIKSLFPENVQPFIAKPMDYMNMMIEYYKEFVSPWMQIDADIMERLAKGDTDAYIDFFKEYQQKYEEELEKYFTVLGFGLNREANEEYMAALNQWNKAMISMGELMAVINKTATESFSQIGEKNPG